MRGMFEGQKQSRILHTAIAAVSKRENQITGITILYHFGKIIHWRYYGSDYRIDNNDFRYFILECYHFIYYAEKMACGNIDYQFLLFWQKHLVKIN